MTKTNQNTAAVRELISRAKKYNDNIGNYVEHFINEEFNYSVRLDNNCGIKVSHSLAQDFSRMPSILSEEDLQRIAASLYRLK